MEFTPHQVRVYENSCTKFDEETKLKNLKSIHDELISLCDLFAYKDTKEKKKLMQKNKQNYNRKLKPEIDDLTRILKNTEKSFAACWSPSKACEAIRHPSSTCKQSRCRCWTGRQKREIIGKS